MVVWGAAAGLPGDKVAKVTMDPGGDIADPFRIVVIGSSAGGLRALEEVVSHFDEDFPVPVVLVQHLDPRHRSLMADILTRHTSCRVTPAIQGEKLEPGVIYIGVPDRHLLITPARTIELTETELVRFVRPSIDLLFESAAGSCREGVLAVVLTGTGSDGADGVRIVDEVGGTVVVQDPATAEFDAMPRAALDTGCADFVLPLDQIGPAVVQLTTQAVG